MIPWRVPFLCNKSGIVLYHISYTLYIGHFPRNCMISHANQVSPEAKSPVERKVMWEPHEQDLWEAGILLPLSLAQKVIFIKLLELSHSWWNLEHGNKNTILVLRDAHKAHIKVVSEDILRCDYHHIYIYTHTHTQHIPTHTTHIYTHHTHNTHITCSHAYISQTHIHIKHTHKSHSHIYRKPVLNIDSLLNICLPQNDVIHGVGSQEILKSHLATSWKGRTGWIRAYEGGWVR